MFQLEEQNTGNGGKIKLKSRAGEIGSLGLLRLDDGTLCVGCSPFPGSLPLCVQNFASAVLGMQGRLSCESWVRGKRK